MLINVFKEQVIWHRYLCWCYERCWCCSFFCCCFNFSALVSVAVIVTAPGPLFLPRIFKLSRSQTQSCRYPTFKRKASVSLSAVKYPKEHLLFSNVNPVSQAEIWLWQVDKCQCGVGWGGVLWHYIAGPSARILIGWVTGLYFPAQFSARPSSVHTCGLLCFGGCESVSKKPINATKSGELPRYTNFYHWI